MEDQKKRKSKSMGPFKKFLRGFLDFCRKFGPGTTGLDHKRVKSMSFDSLKIIGNRQKKLDEINENASSLVKNYLDDVSGLLEFIENRGTQVIIHKNAEKILHFFGEIEGFIPPMNGFRAKLIMYGLKIIGAWKQPIPEETPPLFIFGEEGPTIGYMVHQIHHWLSFNQGLPGYTEETMNNFKKIFDPSFGVQDVQRMTKEEILSLREAIARDQEALDFVQKMAQEIFKPQDIVKGIKDGDKKNI